MCLAPDEHAFVPGHKTEDESKTLEFQKLREDKAPPCKLEVHHSSDQLLGKSTGPEDCALIDDFVDDQAGGRRHEKTPPPPLRGALG